MKNKLVYIGHPVGGDIERNIKKILEICHNIHKKNDNIIPFAPYVVSLYYLDDNIVEERKLGMLANQEHFERKTMDEVWLFGSRISEGMKWEIEQAAKYGIPIKVCNSKLKKEFEKIYKSCQI